MRVVSLGVAISLATFGLLGPAQAARAPKNPAAVNEAQVLETPTSGNSSNPRTAAERHLASQGVGWGIDPAQYSYDSAVAVANDLTVVRFTQHFDDSIFIGALVALTVSSDGALISYTVKSGHAPTSLRSLSESQAIASAQKEFSTSYGIETTGISVAKSERAIADPDVVDYVSVSTWAWIVQLYRKGTLGTDTYVVSDTGSVISHSTDRKDAFDNPLVCDMQQLDSSFSASNQSAVQRGIVSFKASTKYPKKKLKEKKMTGVKNSKVWIVLTASFVNGVSSSITSITVKSGKLVVLTPTFANIPNGKTYSVYIATGKKQPALSSFRLMKSGLTSSSQIKLMGSLPKKTTSLAAAGMGPDRYFSFVDINSSTPGFPICNAANAAVTGAGDDTLTAFERLNTKTYITNFRDFFTNYVNASTDINTEQYLGNISPSLNYGSGATCNEGNEEGVCSPRISAFTNVCATQNGSLQCPNFSNAFWVPWRSSDCRSGVCSAIFIGRGFAADDVIAHELAHGITGAVAFASTSRSADAIAEAYSDFFGEGFDQIANHLSGDANWPIGEDINYGDARGPFRYASAAGSGETPVIDSCWSDSGEGHANMGPYNRFAWLIANGGSPEIGHSGCANNPSLGKPTINALNADKATSIRMMLNLVWTALPNLGTPSAGSSATHGDFRTAVTTACSTLVSQGTAGFTSTECNTVTAALDATGM